MSYGATNTTIDKLCEDYDGDAHGWVNDLKESSTLVSMIAIAPFFRHLKFLNQIVQCSLNECVISSCTLSQNPKDSTLSTPAALTIMALDSDSKSIASSSDDLDSDVEAPLYSPLTFSSNSSNTSDEQEESDGAQSAESNASSSVDLDFCATELESPDAAVVEVEVEPPGSELSDIGEPSGSGVSGVTDVLGATESNADGCSGIKIVGDNVDKNYHASFQRSDDTTHHYFQSYLSKDRVNFSNYSDIKPPPLRVSDVDFSSLLPSAADMATIKRDMTVLLSR